jgi:NAD(P)-dependent dehydrogenase (short-subunit alcohol dehydrogenase family)
MGMEEKAGIVTGAGSGLGREVATLLASQGANVIVFDVNETGANEVARELSSEANGVVPYVGSVAREQDIVDAIGACRDHFGRFDFIHNNAGVQVEKPLHETTNEDWQHLNDVNLTGVFWGCKHAVIAMREGGGGAIVNTASALSLTADPFLPAYTATKHGVLGLTRAVATGYAAEGIRCNCVCPGDMDTPMIQKYFAATPDPAAARAEMESHYPAKKIGHPREVAHVVMFLLSDEASYVNGIFVQADGGLLSKVY